MTTSKAGGGQGENSSATSSAATAPPPKSIIVVGGGVFGLTAAHSLLTSSRYDHTQIGIFDPWQPERPFENEGIIPASIDNSRIIRPDYASKPYARLAVDAQRQWRAGWPLNLPDGSESDHDEAQKVEEGKDSREQQPYRESGLLMTCWESKERASAADSVLNPNGPKYMDDSLSNVQDMATWEPSMKNRIEILPTKELVEKHLVLPGESGDRGYLNRASGWADAGSAMSGLRKRVYRLIQSRHSQSSKAPAFFRQGEHAAVSSLLFGSNGSDSHSGRPIVTGILLASGEEFSSDLVIVAAGAWSPKLLPRTLGRRIRATGQVVGYVDLSVDEAKAFADMPVPINLSTGMFAFPPIAEDSLDRYTMKCARHGWGYSHAVKTPDIEPPWSGVIEESNVFDGTITAAPKTGNTSVVDDDFDSGYEIEVHVPAPDSGRLIGEEGSRAMKQYLTELGVSDRPWTATRTCWYADTATGDWLIDYVPIYANDSLLVATGGSGHAFKFAPVIGDWIVQVLEKRIGKNQESISQQGENHSIEAGTVSAAATERELGRQLADRWRWRSDAEDAANWGGAGDGSRSGARGMIWTDEIGKGAVRGSATAALPHRIPSNRE